MQQNRDFDYKDSFSTLVHTGHGLDAEQLAGRFFSLPRWVAGLMKLRNALVRPLGLKTDKTLSDYLDVKSESLATVVKKDKHLDLQVAFSVGEENGGKRISVSTNVGFNNGFGRMYFAVVKPFHKIICSAMLKRVKRGLERES